jgi:hypothetical protein
VSLLKDSHGIVKLPFKLTHVHVDWLSTQLEQKPTLLHLVQSLPYCQKFTGTGVNLESDFAEVPDGYTLAQNYPNPFNPSTQIKFEIADNANVSLTVYDMLGRVVATLVNTRLQAGTHLFNFDAANLASGIYLYELKTDNGVRLTNKMTLVK